MAGYNDSLNAMKASYANGTLTIERKDGKLVFSGKTYECKRIIKEFGPRGGGAKWNSQDKTWEISEDDMFDGDWRVLDEATNGEIVKHQS